MHFADAENDILFDSREERRVQRVSFSHERNVLASKDVVAIVVEVHQNKSEDLSQVEAGNHLLKGLLTRSRRVPVNNLVELCSWKNFMLIIKSSPFTVDRHWRLWCQVHVGQFGDGADFFHISGVAPCSEDATYLHLGIGVGGSNQGSCSVVDQGCQCYGHTLGVHSD